MDEDSAGLTSSPAVSVVIAAFSMDRWDGLREVTALVRAQTVRIGETVVVVDHNPGLMAKAVSELPGVRVVANAGGRGASAARNTGAAASRGEVLAFLDDDVVAHPNCLAALLQQLKDPVVVGVGGRLEPLWETRRPRWFPPEFDWVLGCSYRGMPESATRVRNVWSSNMAIRRQAFEAVGGFRNGFGKVGARNRPEDTDLCLQAADCNGGGTWIYEPDAIAGHRVPVRRIALSYFVRRCYYEGHGKAELASFNGITDSISAERQYVRSVLPCAIIRGLRETALGKISGMARSFAIVVGLSFAAVGFVVGRTARYAMERHGSTKRTIRRPPLRQGDSVPGAAHQTSPGNSGRAGLRSATETGRSRPTTITPDI